MPEPRVDLANASHPAGRLRSPAAPESAPPTKAGGEEGDGRARASGSREGALVEEDGVIEAEQPAKEGMYELKFEYTDVVRNARASYRGVKNERN